MLRTVRIGIALCLQILLPLAAAPGQDARTVLLRADLRDPGSRAAIERLHGTDPGIAAAATVLEERVSGDALWAAAYVYASGGADPRPLRRLLAEPDVSLRVIAAAGLIALGDASGFDALVEGLRSDAPLRGASPPTPVWTVAAAVLVRMTGLSQLGPRWDANEYRRAAAHRRWRAWLEEHRARLRFDPATGEWVVP